MPFFGARVSLLVIAVAAFAAWRRAYGPIGASQLLDEYDYIVIGAQKGGTETLSYELGALSLDGRRLCHARAEVHFFSSHHFMLHQITDVDLQQYAHTLESLVPPGCLNATDRRLSLLGEKSPGYSYVSFAVNTHCYRQT